MKSLQTYDQFKLILETKDVDLANNRVKQAKLEDMIKKNKADMDKLMASKIKQIDKDTKRSRLEAMIGKSTTDMGKLKQQEAQLMGELAKQQAKL